MTNKSKIAGKYSMAAKFRKALVSLKKKSLADRIQLMVKAKLLTQDQADEAKRKVANGSSFKQLMAGVTTENIHGEVKTARPAGKEAL